MQLAQFMTQECGWTLQVCDSGNLGSLGLHRTAAADGGGVIGISDTGYLMVFV